MKKNQLLVGLLFLAAGLQAQVLTNNGHIIMVKSGGIVAVKGAVENKASGTISNYGNLSASGNFTNNGSITNYDLSNFIQETGSAYSGGGNFTVHKNNTSAANKYAFWSSPVDAQNMFGIFTGGTPQYVMSYDTATDYYTVLANPATQIAGKGYSIKSPAANPAAKFDGTPNNGDITVTLSMAGNKYNLVGNPYPCNLNLVAFRTGNPANIGTTLWFWDNKSNSVTTQSGSTTTNYGYATYNMASETWTAAPSISAVPTGKQILPSQGFIVEAVSSPLNFTNSMRTTAGSTFFNKNANPTPNNAIEGKFWLLMTTPYGTSNMQAITYGGGASNSYDEFDSKAYAIGSDAFYSFAGAEKAVIQGRSSFNEDDVVALGTKQMEQGTSNISLLQKEGIFSSSQNIYLHDKLLNTYTNLQNASCNFVANAGEQLSRFEIVYKQQQLSTAETGMQDEVLVVKDGERHKVMAASEIVAIKVFDLAGRVVAEKTPNAKTAYVDLLQNGMYVFKIKLTNKEISKKVIK